MDRRKILLRPRPPTGQPSGRYRPYIAIRKVYANMANMTQGSGRKSRRAAPQEAGGRRPQGCHSLGDNDDTANRDTPNNSPWRATAREARRMGWNTSSTSTTFRRTSRTWRITSRRIQWLCNRSIGFFRRFHLHFPAQNLVHIRLVFLASAPKPRENVSIESDTYQLLDWSVKPAEPDVSWFWIFLRCVRKVDL